MPWHRSPRIILPSQSLDIHKMLFGTQFPHMMGDSHELLPPLSRAAHRLLALRAMKIFLKWDSFPGGISLLIQKCQSSIRIPAFWDWLLPIWHAQKLWKVVGSANSPMEHAVKCSFGKQIKERGTNAFNCTTSLLKEASLVRLRLAITVYGNSQKRTPRQ